MPKLDAEKRAALDSPADVPAWQQRRVACENAVKRQETVVGDLQDELRKAQAAGAGWDLQSPLLARLNIARLELTRLRNDVIEAISRENLGAKSRAREAAKENCV